MADITTMLASLASSLEPIYRLVGGLAYLLGLLFFYKAIAMLKTYGNMRTYKQSSGNIRESLVYFLVGAIFVFLPSVLQTMSITFFGYDSPLAYSDWFNDVIAKYGSSSKTMMQLTQLAGLVWFIRGWILIVSYRPGRKQGKRGVIYVIAGIMCLNVATTAEVFSNVMAKIAKGTLSVERAK